MAAHRPTQPFRTEQSNDSEGSHTARYLLQQVSSARSNRVARPGRRPLKANNCCDRTRWMSCSGCRWRRDGRPRPVGKNPPTTWATPAVIGRADGA